MKNIFEKLMAEETTIALATSVDNVPNVRIMNFVYLTDEKKLYFQSKKGDQKEKEFIQNNIVSFTTIPTKGLAYVRVIHATVQKSQKTILDLEPAFTQKMPFYKDFIKQNMETIDLYELHFSKVMVFPNPDEFEEIIL